jgi:DNA-binding winged helix-turn-helix (wHTH) protein/tetratricopeptide (TPR) repeat protein
MLLKLGQTLEFGEFCLDPVGRSLSRHGERLTLTRRSFDVLCYLAQRPGQIVTREELLQNVWADANVELNSLTQSISALRRALEERPGENNFIATIPGRGYQFLLPVKIVGDDPPAPAAPTRVVLHERTVSEQRITHEHIPRPRLLPRLAILLTPVLLGVAAWFFFHPADVSSAHVTAVIADLENNTGDPEFDHTLNKVLQIDLQQSPFFTVVSDGRARRTLKSMQQDPTGPITAPLAREICQRLNGQVYIVPSISTLGNRYSLAMELNRCSDGRQLGSSHKESASKNDVLAAWSDLTQRLRHFAGESRASLRDFNKPLYDEPTSSLDALRAYSEATRLGDNGRFQESIALYQHAVDLDPNFALAYADMSSMYYNVDDELHAKPAIAKAYALRQTANEREQFYIEFRYAQSVTGDLPAQLTALHRWAAMYPQDNLPLADLVNFETWTGHYPEAAAYADRVTALEQRMGVHNGISYEIAARAYHHANLPDRLRATYAAALQWKVDTQGLHGIMLQFAAEHGDWAEVDRQVNWSRNTPNETHLLQEAGMAVLAAGQVHKADALFTEARHTAQRDQMQSSLADIDDYYARMLVELGFTDRARQLIHQLPPNDPSLDLAFAQAALGDTAPALAAAQRMQAASPNDTLVNASYVPSIQAIIALNQSHPDRALQDLTASQPYELRDPTVPYLRGQAYLAAHQPAQAIAEFSKLANHPWINDPPAPLTALATLGIARAYAQQHQDALALAAYRNFLATWSSADPDIPILIQARKELDALIANSH